MNPCPLAFQLLLERLKQLEAQLVREDTFDGRVIMVYEHSTGYYPCPGGKRYPLIDRPPDQHVPIVEIEKLLAHIGFSWEEFWKFPDELEVLVQTDSMTATAPKKNRSAGYFEPRPKIPNE